MNSSTIILIAIASLFGFASIFTGALLIFSIADKSKKKNALDRSKYIKREKIYSRFIRIPFIGSYVSSVKARIAMFYADDEITLKAKTVKAILISLLIAIAWFTGLSYFLSKDIYTKILIFITSVYVFNTVTDMLCGNETRMLTHLIDSVNDIKHHYNESNNALSALYTSVIEADIAVSKHLRAIHEVLKCGKEALLGYHTVCQNRFLKILASAIYLTQENSENNSEGVTKFMKNMNHIIEEIHMEILRREALQFWLRASVVISVLPLVFMKPIEAWMNTYFPSAAYIYDSSTGFYFRLTIVVSAFICYSFIKKLQNSASGYNLTKIKNSYWEDRLIQNRVVSFSVRILKPKVGSARESSLKRLIAESGNFCKLEWVYLYKMGWFISGIILAIVVMWSANNLDIDITSKKVVYVSNSSVYSSMIGKGDDSEQDERKKMEDTDVAIIKMLRSKTLKKEEVSSKVAEQLYATKSLSDGQKAVINSCSVNLLLIVKSNPPTMREDVINQILVEMFAGKPVTGEMQKRIESTADDLITLSRTTTVTREIIFSSLANLVSTEAQLTDEQKSKINEYTERIDKKYTSILTKHLSLFNILIAAFLGFILSFKPNLMMWFQQYIRKVDMQDEVFQYHMIVILLMHYDSASNQMVLEWMSNFANIFYNPIIQCVSNYTRGPKDALLTLKESVRYKPFSRLVDNLLIAEDIGLQKAFESIEMERTFYRDERKEQNKRQVDARVNLGQMIGFIPMYEVTFLYIIYPLVVASYNQLTAVMSVVN